MTTTAIASTQKAGEGDATILGNNSRPIAENLLAQASQQAKAKAAGDLLKQKGIQENQTKFFQNLGGLKEKVWMQDIPEITGDVNALIDKAVQMQKSGINPFDPNNGSAYTELWGDIEKLQAKQEASKSAELRFNNALSTLDKDKGNDLDIMKTKVILDAGAGKKIMERTTEDFNVAYAPVDFSKKLKEVDKIVLPQLKMAKSYYDQNQVDVANKAIEDMKLMIPDFVTGLYSREIAQGRTTPEEALQRATEYVNTLTQDASLDPTKVNELAFKKEQQADLNADRARRFKLASEKFQFAKSLQEIKSTEVDDLFKSISEGLPVSSMALANQTIQNPKTGELVITGAFTPIKNKNNEVVGVNIETFKEVEENGVKKIVKQGNITSPILDSKKNPVYSTTQIYKSAFATSSKNKAPVTNYTVNETGDFELIEKDQKQVGSKQTQSEKTSKSTTTVNNTTPKVKKWNPKTKRFE